MERATKGPLFVIDLRPDQERLTVTDGVSVVCRIENSVRMGDICPDDVANAELIAFLYNHAPALAAVVRAAEVMLDHAPPVVVSGREGTNYYANDVLRQALATLNGEAKP